jgi:hypothetical protein
MDPGESVLIDDRLNPTEGGLTMFPNTAVNGHQTLETIAYHEAGHVVMAVLQGLYLDRTAIIAWGAGEAARRGNSIIGYPPSSAGKRKQAQSLLAGPLAEERYLGTKQGLWCISCDRLATLEMVPSRRKAGGAMFKWYYKLQAETMQLVAEHWALVCAVAIALLQNRMLTGDRVKEIMRGAGWKESFSQKTRAQQVSRIVKNQRKELKGAREAFAA